MFFSIGMEISNTGFESWDIILFEKNFWPARIFYRPQIVNKVLLWAENWPKWHPKITKNRPLTQKNDFFKVWKELEIFFFYNMSSSEKNVSNLKVLFLVFFKSFFSKGRNLKKKFWKAKTIFYFQNPSTVFFRKRGAPERNGSRRREGSGGASRFRKQKRCLGFKNKTIFLLFKTFFSSSDLSETIT